MNKPVKTTATISAIKNLAEDVKHLELIPNEQVPFKAGQFINLSFKDQDKNYKKSYSISSPPTQKTIELCIKLVPQGNLTPKLWEKKQGDEVELMGGLGLFNTDKITKQNIVLIGTGTGIAPLRAILKEQLQQEIEKEFQLIFGAKDKQNLYYDEEFQLLEKTYPNFKYTPVLSRENPESQTLIRQGYVQQNLDNINIQDSHVFICGNPKMVDDVKNTLLIKGMGEEDISVEKY